MSLKFIFFLIWLFLLIFFIWFFFFRNKNQQNNIENSNSEKKEDLKEKFLIILIEIFKIPQLSQKDRNRIYDELEEIVNILEKLEKIDIPSIKRYEIEKLIGDYLFRLVLSLSESNNKDVDKLLEGINIIKTQLEKIYNDYIQNNLDLEKEIEFLKRKFKSI